MDFAVAVTVVVVGLVVEAWGVWVLVQLTRSPDSDWIVGSLYGGPFMVAGAVALTLGIGLLRRRR